MNLITGEERWLPVIRASGEGYRKDKILPWQIAESVDPVIEIDAPRPDFQGALYQFLIGLIQTCFAPKDHDEWLEYWERMPDVDVLKSRFANVAPAFELSNPINQPTFMQDINLDEGEMKAIASLLIDAPGGKTIRDNLDHFVKRDTVKNMCQSCAAIALFTLQTNAPSGGVGHRVGLRGGGPLTTLVMPTEKSSLWRKLWLNVIDAEGLTGCIEKPSSDVFPWLSATRKGNVETRPEDGHQLQAYWGMPRRIRLVFSNNKSDCEICEATNVNVVSKYRTQNYGVNYVGEWVHPLTPYWFDLNKVKPPRPTKGKEGNLGYRHWVSYILTNKESAVRPAKNAVAYMEQRALDIGGQRRARLWCFGYHTENMKAYCWYEDIFPLFCLNQKQRDNLFAWAGDLITAADEVAHKLQYQIKAAWYSEPGDVKGTVDTIEREFWAQSENVFYDLLEQLALLPDDRRTAPVELYAVWVNKIRSLAYKLFDEWALESPAEDLNMKRIVKSRNTLEKALSNGKEIKGLLAKAGMGKEVKNAASGAV